MNPTSQFCSHCGAALAPDAKFCAVCGKPTLTHVPGTATPPAPQRRAGAARWLLPGLIGLLLACLVCVLLGGLAYVLSPVPGETLRSIFENNGVDLPMATPPVEQATPALATTQPQPSATAQPTPIEQVVTPEPTQPAATITPVLFEMQYQNVRLAFSPAIASQITGKTIPANSGADVAPWEIAPEYIQLDLQGYPLQGDFHNPQIFIYPVDAYLQLVPDIQTTITALQQALHDQPAQPGPHGMPFLPNWNAAQMIAVQIRYLGPQGVRYLSQYGQDISPINNNALFYTYQGLSADGKYYLAAILPVHSAVLPAANDLTGAEYDAFAKNYPTYLEETRAQLNQQPADSFSPSLEALDALMQSIVVQ